MKFLFFENGDIVLNFYRSKAYRFEKENKQHLKDFFRSRIATFEEAKRFNKLGKDIVKLSELGLSRAKGMRWKNLEYAKITLLIDKTTLLEIHKYIHENDLAKSYESFIYHALLNANTDYMKIEIEKEFAKEKHEIKEKQNKLDNFINAFKELIK